MHGLSYAQHWHNSMHIAHVAQQLPSLHGPTPSLAIAAGIKLMPFDTTAAVSGLLTDSSWRAALRARGL